jgi:hypothetical protein
MFPLSRDGGFDPRASSAATSTAPRTIKEGDLVVFYETPMNMKAITVSAKGQHQNRFGAFPHKVTGRHASGSHSKRMHGRAHAWEGSCMRGLMHGGSHVPREEGR